MLTLPRLSSSDGMLALDSKPAREESNHLELILMGRCPLTQMLDIYGGFSERTPHSHSVTLLANFAQKDIDSNSQCVTGNQR